MKHKATSCASLKYTVFPYSSNESAVLWTRLLGHVVFLGVMSRVPFTPSLPPPHHQVRENLNNREGQTYCTPVDNSWTSKGV